MRKKIEPPYALQIKPQAFTKAMGEDGKRCMLSGGFSKICKSNPSQSVVNKNQALMS